MSKSAIYYKELLIALTNFLFSDSYGSLKLKTHRLGFIASQISLSNIQLKTRW